MQPSTSFAIAAAFTLLSLSGSAHAQIEVPKQMAAAARFSGQQRIKAFWQQLASSPDRSLSFPQINSTEAGNASYITLDVGTLGAFPAAINAEGTVIGQYFAPGLSLLGFVRTPDSRVTTLAIPKAGTGAYQGAYPSAINDFGVITGSYYDVNNLSHGFLALKKVFGSGYDIVEIDVPGAGNGTYQGSSPLALNNFGMVTGNYYDADNVSHGFVRDTFGKLTSFDPAGSINTFPTGINDWGTVAGSYSDSNNVAHGFLRAIDGTLKTFDGPDSTLIGLVTAINVMGEITGTYFHSVPGNFFGSIYSAFIRRSDGSYITFDGSNSIYVYETYPLGINAEGDTTGFYITPTVAFVREASGTLTAIDATGGTGTTFPVSINVSGAITGYFYLPGEDVGHGFVRLPNSKGQ